MSDARWKRPAEVPFPSVWRRYTGKRPLADGSLPCFCIQDINEELIDGVIDHMSDIFLRDETMCSSSRLWEDATSLAEIRTVWRKMLGHRVGLVALVEGKTDAQGRPLIAGCNITAISHKADKDIPFSFKGKAMNKVIAALEYITALDDVFARYNVHEYMTALGLSVASEFRGQALGIELLRARFDMGRAIRLQLTVTIFTSVAGQTQARRVGMEELKEVQYDEFKLDGEVVFPGVKTKSMILMAKRIEQIEEQDTQT